MSNRLSVGHVFGKIWAKSKPSTVAICGLLLAQSLSMPSSAATVAPPATAPSATTPVLTHMPTAPSAPKVPSASSILTPAIASSLAKVVNATQLVINVGNLSKGVYSVSGNFINNNNLVFVSTNPSIHTATFQVSGRLFNPSGTSISTVVPSGYANAIPNLDLVITSKTGIYNAGSITSSGALTLKAPTISNALPTQSSQGSSGASALPTLQSASGDLTLQTSTLLNQGAVATVNGNINIISATENLAINATGGSFNASSGQGAVNIGTSAASGTLNLQLVGGDFVSQSLNVNAGASGTVSMAPNSVSGKLNLIAENANFSVNSGSLTLGNLSVSGDPYITDGSGDVTFSGATDVGDLGIVATNILSDGTASEIKTNNGILLVASGNIDLASVGQISTQLGRIVITAGGYNNVSNAQITSNGGIVVVTANQGDLGVGSINSGASSGPGGSVFLASANGSVTVGSITTGAIAPPLYPQGTTAVYPVAIGAYNKVSAGSITAPGGAVYIAGGVTSTLGQTGGTIEGPGTDFPFGQGSGGLTVGTINTKLNYAGTGSVTVYALNSGPASVAGIVGDASVVYVTSNSSLVIPNGILNNNPGGAFTTGAAGSVFVQATQSAPFVIGPGSGEIFINNNAVGAGGSIFAGNSGPLTVKSAGIQAIAQNGKGTNYTFLAYNSNTITVLGAINANGGQNGPGGFVTIAGGDINIQGDQITANGAGSGVGGYIAINAVPGALTITNATITANGGSNGGAGGYISIGSSGLIAGHATVSANGYGGGAGGTISIQSNAGPAVIGKGDGTFSATGANGGSIYIQASGGDLTVNTNSFNVAPTVSPQGNGGTISIIDYGNLSVVGNLNADGVGTGRGGSITLHTSGDYVVGNGGPTLTARGGTGGGNGGSISVSAEGNLTIANNGVINVDARGQNGNGGTISLIGGAAPALGPNLPGGITLNRGLSANGIGTGNGGNILIQGTAGNDAAGNVGGINVNGALSANAGATGIYGGSVTVQLILAPTVVCICDPSVNINANITADGGKIGTAGNINITAQGVGNGVNLGLTNIFARGGTTSGNGGSVIITADGAINDAGAKIDVSGRGAGGGGSIYLSSGLGGVGGISATASGYEKANGGVTGFGGAITVITGGSGSSTSIMSPLYAQGGTTSGDGGYISVSVSGTAATGVINASAKANGNGGIISLNAGTAGTGDLNLIGTVSANGVLNGIGGSISLTAGGGGGLANITNSDAITAKGAGTGAGGLISLTTNGVGSINAQNIYADAGGSGTGGSVTFSNASATLTVNTSGLISANSTSGILGNIIFANPGQAIMLSDSGTITGALSASGSAVTISILTSNAKVSFGALSASAGDINLIASGAGTNINLPIPVQVSATGNVNITALANVSIGSNPGSKDDVKGTDITVKGNNVTINGELNSTDAISINAAGVTTLGQNITATNTISIDSTGNITGSGTVTSQTINFLSENGSVGTKTNPLSVSASNVAVIALNEVSIKNTGTPSTLAGAAPDGVTIGSSASGGNFSFSSDGDITIAGPVGPVGDVGTKSNLLIQTIANDGNIFINGSVIAAGLAQFTANGSGMIVQQNSATRIIASDIKLSSSTGDIGSPLSPILTAAQSTLSANTVAEKKVAGSNAYVSQLGNAMILSSQTSGDLQFTITGSAAIAGTLLAKDITITTLSLGSSGTGSNLKVTTTGTLQGASGLSTPLDDNGSITLVAAGAITLAGDLQSATISITTSTGSNGGVFIGANVSAIVSKAFSPTLTITVDGKGSINERAGLLTAQQKDSSYAALYPGVLSLTTVDGAIGAPSQVSFLQTDADVITANTGTLQQGGCSPCLGPVNILQDRTVQLGPSTAGGALTILVNGSLSIYNPSPNPQTTISGKSINLSALSSTSLPPAGPGDFPTLSVGGANLLTPQGAYSSPTDTIVLASDGNITQTFVTATGAKGYSGSLQAPNTRMTTGLGSIGEADSPIVLQGTTDLFAVATGVASNIFISQPISPGSAGAGVLAITTLSAHSINVVAQANIIVNGPVTSPSGGAILLVAQPNFGITIGGDISANIVGLLVQGAGNIDWKKGTLTGASVSLQTNSGFIGENSAPIVTATSNLLAATSSAGIGNVFIKNTGNLILASSSAGGTFQLVNNGIINLTSALKANTVNLQANNGSISISQPINAVSSLTVTSAQGLTVNAALAASAGPINLINKTGAINIQSGSSLQALNGDLDIQDNDHTAGAITIGSGVNLSANGNVRVTIGATPSNPSVGTPPSNLAVNLSNGGQVYFGKNGITTNCCNSVASADGSKIIFNTGSLQSSAINIEDSVVINASTVAWADPEPDFLPVSFNDSSTGSPLLAIRTKTCEISQLGRAVVGSSKNAGLLLKSGEIIINAFQKTSIKIGENKLVLQPGAVVRVAIRNDVLIQDLVDRRNHSVTVMHKNIDSVNLAPGEQLRISDHSVGSMDRVGMRRIRTFHLAKNILGCRRFPLFPQLLIQKHCAH